MGLSSNILWHQTKKDVLMKILKQKRFLYSYSLEYINYDDTFFELAVPVLSLCDIPFADISDYLTKYGGNSIGLSREWGIKHGITPVIYCEKTSPLLIKIGQDYSENNKLSNFYWEILSHIKNHEGSLPKYNYKNYRFYDEHEVRIIPTVKNLTDIKEKLYLSKDEYKKYKSRNKNSSIVSDILSVPFDYNDIKYFILKDEDSINEIKKILTKEIDLSQNRISFFTISQVKADFIGNNHNEVSYIEKIDVNNHRDNSNTIFQKIDVNKKKIVHY